MPKISIADLFRDWDKLFTAAAEHAESIPGLKSRLSEFGDVTQRTRELENLRLRLQAERQAATQDLDVVKGRGKELATEIRHILKAAFGQRNEGLVAFNIRPRRRRHRGGPDPAMKPLAPAENQDPDEEM